jgi:hypothetical protein
MRYENIAGTEVKPLQLVGGMMRPPIEADYFNCVDTDENVELSFVTKCMSGGTPTKVAPVIFIWKILWRNYAH